MSEIYQGLAIIERGWREIKSVMEVRPLQHRLQRRIEAHLLICSLAFLVERYVELKVREAKLEREGRPLTSPAAVKRFESLVVNRQKIAEGVRFNQFTELDAQQRAIVQAVELRVEQFAKGWTVLKYPEASRKHLYTTNTVESMNAGLEMMRSALGGYFPSRKALDVNYFIQMENRNHRWMKKPHDGPGQCAPELHQMYALRYEQKQEGKE